LFLPKLQIIADDFALIGGLVIFIILVCLIFIFAFTGTSKQSYAAVPKDGKVLAGKP
jgi:hypothetical protein